MTTVRNSLTGKSFALHQSNLKPGQQTLARRERFELPTFWFIAAAARQINDLATDGDGMMMENEATSRRALLNRLLARYT